MQVELKKKYISTEKRQGSLFLSREKNGVPLETKILVKRNLGESKRLVYTSVSLLLSCIQGYRYHLSKFHIYALVYCIGGEGNGNPLQYSCLENPMDGSLIGCSAWGREESDTTEGLHFHFSFSCTGEGNGNPLQCSCLENPRDGRAID